MKSKKFFINISDKKARKQIVEMIQVACAYKSSVMIEKDSKKFNAKSIMMTGELIRGDQFHLIIEGADEQEALKAFEKFFEER